MIYLPKKHKSKTLQKGQALLVLLLSMAVILTIVLSSVSRTVTDVSISSYEEDALRAFSAAEAGIEKALLTGSGTGGTYKPVDPSDTAVNYASVITSEAEGTDYGYPDELSAGETATFWLVSHDEDGNLDCSSGSCFKPGPGKNIQICWGNESEISLSQEEQPAIVVSVYYDDTLSAISPSHDYSNVKVKRFAFDRYPESHNNNGFQSGGVNFGECSVDGKDHLFKSPNISSTSICNDVGCMLMIKVRMYYNTTPQSIAIKSSGGPTVTFPAQGKHIESTGVAGESTRKVNVFQSFSEPPSIFDGAIFSLSDFIK